MNVPDLREYDKIVISTSGGKDSSVAAWNTVRLAEGLGIKDRLLLVHAEIKQEEWAGTVDVVRKQAAQVDVPLEVVRRIDCDGKEQTLLEAVLRRRKWPSPTQRYCTSDFKRGPIGRVVTKVAPGLDRHMRVLNVMGIRAQESPTRAKKSPFMKGYGRWSNGRRTVDTWFPIFDMKVEEVWKIIKENRIPEHPAYAVGLPRASCVLCIFAPKSALVLAGRHNPELLRKYVEVEREIGHQFRGKPGAKGSLSMAEVLDAVESGEEVEAVSDWKM